MPLRLYAFLHPPVCKKCLSAAIQTAHCTETLCNGYAIGRDHLHRTCQTCGYPWLEECQRFAYRLIREAATDGETLTRIPARRAEEALTTERAAIPGGPPPSASEPLRGRPPRTPPTPDPEFVEMRDRLAYLLREVMPFEGTMRELVARLLETFPKLEWLRDPRRVGPFAKMLEAQRAALSAAGIDLSIERSDEGPNRIRMTAAPGENGVRFASTEG